jgi:antitoxin ParD1/3/4
VVIVHIGHGHGERALERERDPIAFIQRSDDDQSEGTWIVFASQAPIICRPRESALAPYGPDVHSDDQHVATVADPTPDRLAITAREFGRPPEMTAESADGGASMPTRSVVLSDHQHAFVESLIASGRYRSASEVLREGLRLLERREAEDAARLEALRSAIDQGWADLAAGRYTEVIDDEVEPLIRRLGDSGPTAPDAIRAAFERARAALQDLEPFNAADVIRQQRDMRSDHWASAESHRLP